MYFADLGVSPPMLAMLPLARQLFNKIVIFCDVRKTNDVLIIIEHNVFRYSNIKVVAQNRVSQNVIVMGESWASVSHDG